MFLQPEKVPVKVYLSTDKDAPQLDRTPNCMATILKACLVTGYGTKEGAGWSLAFEDDKVKVLKPADSPHTPFFVKVSNDTGREATVQVMQDMTKIDDGTLLLQCDTPFKYGIKDVTSSKWVVIACDRAFWLFHETAKRVTATQSGVYLYCGDTAKNTLGDRAVYLHHTGGTWQINDDERYNIVEKNASSGSGYLDGKLFDPKTSKTVSLRPFALFDGKTKESERTLLSPILVKSGNEIWALPAFMPSTIVQHNYGTINAYGRTLINHATGTKYINNCYVPIDYWEF